MLISEKWSQCDRLVTNGDTYSKNRSKHPHYIVQYGILSETVALKAKKRRWIHVKSSAFGNETQSLHFLRTEMC